MEYQITVARNPERSRSKFRVILLSVLAILAFNILGIILNFTAQTFSLANLAISATCAITLFARKDDVFLKIADNAIEYFDFEENQLVSIPAADIQRITTRFGELHLSTGLRTYCIDMKKIPNEKTRWEIKEMIRNMASLQHPAA